MSRWNESLQGPTSSKSGWRNVKHPLPSEREEWKCGHLDVSFSSLQYSLSLHACVSVCVCVRTSGYLQEAQVGWPMCMHICVCYHCQPGWFRLLELRNVHLPSGWRYSFSPTTSLRPSHSLSLSPSLVPKPIRWLVVGAKKDKIQGYISSPLLSLLPLSGQTIDGLRASRQRSVSQCAEGVR